MKEDILEQLVDDYLQMQGYFTRHNVKFKPRTGHPDFNTKHDSNHSDIDVIGYNPRKSGVNQVWVISCKSWQPGFRVNSKIAEIEQEKIVSGREAWKAFRELSQPKWSEAFLEAIYSVTGSHAFTYVTAVTKVVGDPKLWEEHKRFCRAMKGNPIKLLSLAEMLRDVSAGMNTTVASSEFGRTVQLLKASGVLKL